MTYQTFCWISAVLYLSVSFLLIAGLLSQNLALLLIAGWAILHAVTLARQRKGRKC